MFKSIAAKRKKADSRTHAIDSKFGKANVALQSTSITHLFESKIERVTMACINWICQNNVCTKGCKVCKATNSNIPCSCAKDEVLLNLFVDTFLLLGSHQAHMRLTDLGGRVCEYGRWKMRFKATSIYKIRICFSCRSYLRSASASVQSVSAIVILIGIRIFVLNKFH